jgi:hypothetical protein
MGGREEGRKGGADPETGRVNEIGPCHGTVAGAYSCLLKGAFLLTAPLFHSVDHSSVDGVKVGNSSALRVR